MNISTNHPLGDLTNTIIHDGNINNGFQLTVSPYKTTNDNINEDNTMAAKDAVQKEKESHKEQIYYSDTYKDEMYEYRHVILPKEIAKKVPKGRLLTEHEWRHLGVQQSLGWVHFMIHEPEPHILIFRRSLKVSQQVQQQRAAAAAAAHAQQQFNAVSKCPGDKKARCIPNYCGGCIAVWYAHNGKQAKCQKNPTCPPGQTPVKCLKDPCQGAKCPAYPNAKCVSNYCGGCHAIWYKTDGTPVNCNKSPSCPPGQTEVKCVKDPCQGAKCPAYPNAKCVSNYCGGCHALWYRSDGTPVNCNKSAPCPPGQTEVQCFVDPCQVAKCPAYPNAKCVSNYCGGCNALWYNSDGTLVNCNKSSSCPPGQSEVQCLVDPCQGATCPACPNAKCVSNYCGGCHALWYKSDGTPVNCNKSSPCPPGQDEVQCKKDPCEGAKCPAHANVNCVPNYCGGCKAEWFTSNGKQVQCVITN
ncbi:unnamed protein product [Rotaria sordida]|uniref:Cyclin-dependent kinases regulatory subunit n=1 Tax=Rotaria sordida TaxID=392033 RepID=A0A814Y458_9BILA|nr:unnamed protein product [Rotaria sordida]